MKTHFIHPAAPCLLFAACLFVYPTPGLHAELPPTTSALVDEFMAQAGFAPIKIEKDSKTLHDVNKRWEEWMDQKILAPCRERVKKSHPSEAAEVADLLTRTIKLKLKHPDNPREIDDRAERDLFKLAEEVVAMKIDDPVVGLMSVVSRLPRQDYRSENEKILEDAGKKADSEPVRYFIAYQRSLYMRDDVGTKLKFKAAMDLLTDESFRHEDEDIILPLLKGRISLSYDAKLVDALMHAPQWSEWARLTLEGIFEVKKAWEARGSGYASAVTEAGWEGFGKHLDLARTALTKAWKLRPDLPYAASEMIKVTMGYGDHGEGSLRDWFDRAVAARLDYIPAYDQLIFALMPRWGGSQEEMVAFGLACAKTRRFDTDVPAYLATALRSVKDDGLKEWKALFSNELIRPVLIETCAAYLDEPSQEDNEHNNRSRLVLYSFVCGDLERAGKELSNLEGMSNDFKAQASYFGLAEKSMKQDMALNRKGMLDAFHEAQGHYDRGDLPAAKSALEKVIAAMLPDDVPAAAELREAIHFEEELAKGEWVRPRVTSKLEGWRAIGFKGTDEGVIEAPKFAFRLTKLGRTGANVEIRGEFTLTTGKVPADSLVVLLNNPQTNAPSNTIGAGVVIAQDGKTLFASLYDGNRPTGEYTKIGTMPDKFTFHVTLRDGKVTFVLNDKAIFTEVTPHYAGKNTPEMHPSENASFGFGFHGQLVVDGLVRIPWLEVRKLKSGSGPANR